MAPLFGRAPVPLGVAPPSKSQNWSSTSRALLDAGQLPSLPPDTGPERHTLRRPEGEVRRPHQMYTHSPHPGRVLLAQWRPGQRHLVGKGLSLATPDVEELTNSPSQRGHRTAVIPARGVSSSSTLTSEYSGSRTRNCPRFVVCPSDLPPSS